ncbi:hypothetical protein BJ912DRAFT_951378 [Pholiota molesta]|nr:hypothetical protein BJ912DRAFT_951378 [Pholiota molesta]
MYVRRRRRAVGAAAAAARRAMGMVVYRSEATLRPPRSRSRCLSNAESHTFLVVRPADFDARLCIDPASGRTDRSSSAGMLRIERQRSRTRRVRTGYAGTAVPMTMVAVARTAVLRMEQAGSCSLRRGSWGRCRNALCSSCSGWLAMIHDARSLIRGARQEHGGGGGDGV